MNRQPYDLPAELASVASLFRDATEGPAHSAGPGAADPGIRPENILVALPFLLAEALPFEGARAAARTMAVANCCGAAHFLIGDDWLDGEDRPSPGSCHLADRCLGRFFVLYDRLVGADADFARRLDAYLCEYYESLAWERSVLRTPEGLAAVGPDRLAGSLDSLGKRLAPLKATVAALCLLSGRADARRAGERFVDEFHVAYQLEDDLSDLLADLKDGRWSLVSWMVAAAAGTDRPPSGEDPLGAVKAAVPVLADVAAEIERRYEAAITHARSLNAVSLAEFARRRRDGAAMAASRTARRARLLGMDREGARCAAGARRNVGERLASCAATLLEGLHVFRVGDDGFLFDRGSGLFFETDGVALDVLERLRDGAGEARLADLAAEHGRAAIDAAVGEIAAVGGASEPRPAGGPRCPEPAGITSLALNVTDACNLACGYCYLSGERREGARVMPEAVAAEAIDLLLREPTGRRRLSIVFFGGEPLLHPDLIERIASRARSAAAARGRAIELHATTNGTLLAPPVAARLQRAGVRLLVSIDGPRPAHDAHRIFPDGRGSYDVVASNIRRLPRGVRVAARATISDRSASLVSTAEHLSELGFPIVHLIPVSGEGMTEALAARLEAEFEALAGFELDRIAAGGAPLVGNFVDPMRLLKGGGARDVPCGAGARYVCVDPDGALYFCHRFAGRAGFHVGNVADGIDRAAVRRILRARAEATASCGACWALPLCGGPCLFDARTPAPGGCAEPLSCRVRRRVFELAMWIYASLPEARRREVAAGPR